MRTPSRWSRFRWLRTLCVVALAAWLLPVHVAAADYSRYQNYQELTASLKALVAAHPTLAKLSSIGKTREGRDIWVVELANPTGVKAAQRPALLVTANLEGDHLVGSALALYTIEALLTGYATDAAIKQRLDHHVFYIIPRLNPDGAEALFGPVKTWRRTNATPHDADNDGRMDEDGPEDLNKDGVATLMRVKDPKGAYMISPEDARLMKRADPSKGESGGYALYWEGVDKDKDGFIAEDGPGGLDINRNFMHQYPYHEPDAGRHMASEAETRALLDFVIQHRNIAAMLSFGESDNLVTAPSRAGELGPAAPLSLLDFAARSVADARKVGIFPDLAPVGRGRGFSEEEFMMGGRGGAAQPSTGRGAPARRPAITVNGSDYEYFRAISEKYRELTGIRATGVTRSPAGAFFEYGYYQYGVPSFSTPGWGLPARAAGGQAGPEGRGAAMPQGTMPGRGGRPVGLPGSADAEGADVRMLQWMDAEKVDGFVNWTAFNHPVLGAVEIGGFKPLAAVNPPAARIAELGAAHAKFAVYLSSLFAKVKIAKADVKPLGAGLYSIKADIENTGYLPTALAHAVTARAVAPVMVQIAVAPESIVTGSEKTMYLPALAGSGNRQSYEWVIKGKPGTSFLLTVASQKGGTDSMTLSLQ